MPPHPGRRPRPTAPAEKYVKCTTCKSPHTLLTRENRMSFMTCETCGARKTVESISSGYQAGTEKRSRVRAKMG